MSFCFVHFVAHKYFGFCWLARYCDARSRYNGAKAKNFRDYAIPVWVHPNAVCQRDEIRHCSPSLFLFTKWPFRKIDHCRHTGKYNNPWISKLLASLHCIP
jgi:hypothetical protein